MAEVHKASITYLKGQRPLLEQLNVAHVFGYNVLFEAVPSDFESLTKIGYFPFAEATIEMNYAVAFGLGGVYKTAYSCLRRFLELCFTGLFFLCLESKKMDGVQWLKGQKNTPFKSNILEKLFEEPYFQQADKSFRYQEIVNQVYSKLNDYVHTKGKDLGHLSMSHSNLPSFVPESLKKFIDTTNDTAEVIAIALILKYPWLLIPLPVTEKFGSNPPLTGFLEHRDVELIERLISPEKLGFLRELSEADEGAQSIKNWMESRPDIPYDLI